METLEPPYTAGGKRKQSQSITFSKGSTQLLCAPITAFPHGQETQKHVHTTRAYEYSRQHWSQQSKHPSSDTWINDVTVLSKSNNTGHTRQLDGP